MDRRQKKTRELIFASFTKLLSKKDFNKITVAEIIDDANIGRATFYSHFESKDLLLRELCDELFCHIFDTENNEPEKHRHIFTCDCSHPIFLHLLLHLQRNDNNVLELLSSQNNELFLRYFRTALDGLVESHLSLFEEKRDTRLPESFWKNHIASTFVETLRWWLKNGMKESPEEVAELFFRVV